MSFKNNPKSYNGSPQGERRWNSLCCLSGTLCFPSDSPFSASKVMMTKESLRVACVFTPSSVDASYEQGNMQSWPESLLRATEVCAGLSSPSPELLSFLKCCKQEAVPLTLTLTLRSYSLHHWRNLELTLVDLRTDFLNCSNLWEIKAKAHSKGDQNKYSEMSSWCAAPCWPQPTILLLLPH